VDRIGRHSAWIVDVHQVGHFLLDQQAVGVAALQVDLVDLLEARVAGVALAAVTLYDQELRVGQRGHVAGSSVAHGGAEFPSKRAVVGQRRRLSKLHVGHEHRAAVTAVTIRPGFGRREVRKRSHKVACNSNNDTAFRRERLRR
jgi:hypothetical protein